MVGSKYCVEYYFYNEDNLPVQSFAFVIATSDEEAIQKAQNYSTSKITIISCTKYALIITKLIPLQGHALQSGIFNRMC